MGEAVDDANEMVVVVVCSCYFFFEGGVCVFRSECAHNILPICNRDLQGYK